METRAHFIVIGLFTLLGMLGGLGFFVWLASVQIDRQYAQYGILFDNVAGLDQSADVLFNGVNVGRVVSIRIWEDNPAKVFVGVEIDATTPIRSDTMAQLESQGVTGVAYIALAGGSSDALALSGDGDEPPIIPSRRSSLQSLVSDAPDLIEDATRIMAQLETLTGPENQEYIKSILRNVDGATAELDAALNDFSDITTTIRDATTQITVFTDGLDTLSSAAEDTLAATDDALIAATQTFEEAAVVLEQLKPAISAADAAFVAMETLITAGLSPLPDQLSATLTNADTTIATIDQVLISVDAVLATDITPVLADVRSAAAAFGNTMQAISADVPVIMSELRGAVADVRQAIAAAKPGLRDFGQLGGEARALLRSIGDVVRRLERDPTRFLLDDRVPDYRR